MVKRTCRNVAAADEDAEETKDPGQATVRSLIYPLGNVLDGSTGLEVAGRSTSEVKLLLLLQRCLLPRRVYQPKNTVTNAVHPWLPSRSTALNAAQKYECRFQLSMTVESPL